MFVKNQPCGVNPVSDLDRIRIHRFTNGDTWRIDVRLHTHNTCGMHEEATPGNSIVKFVLSENRFYNNPYWIGTWNNGVEKDVNRPFLAHVTIPRTIASQLRRGVYSYAVKVYDITGSESHTEETGYIQVEYEATSPNHNIPYRGDSSSEILPEPDSELNKFSRYSPRTLPDYLHYIEFDDPYWEDAKRLYETYEPVKSGCSAFVKDGYFGRNYDFTYGSSGSYVVSMRGIRKDGEILRHSSIGVAYIDGLTDQIANSGIHSHLYRCLPGFTVDGINDSGLFACINVVHRSERDSGWHGSKLNMLGAVRHVLDSFSSPQDAAVWVQDNAYMPEKFRNTGFSLHMMVGNSDEVWIVEDGVAHKLNGVSIPAMTNYRLFDENGVMHTDYDEIAEYDPYGSGIERVALLTSDIAGDSVDEEPLLRIKSVWYTNAYRPYKYDWISEFTDEAYGATLSDTVKLRQVQKYCETRFMNRRRDDGLTWQTVHSCVYDIAGRSLRIACQENDEWYSFAVPHNPFSDGDTYTTGEIDSKVSSIDTRIDSVSQAMSGKVDKSKITVIKELDEQSTQKQIREKLKELITAWNGAAE